jgi:hypothetical protein
MEQKSVFFHAEAAKPRHYDRGIHIGMEVDEVYESHYAFQKNGSSLEDLEMTCSRVCPSIASDLPPGYYDGCGRRSMVRVTDFASQNDLT